MIQKFKKQLAEKITATVKAAQEDDYTTFLKHFGRFKVAGLNTEEVSEHEYLTREFANLRNEMRYLASSVSTKRRAPATKSALTSIERLHKSILDGISVGELDKEDIIQRNTPKILSYLADDQRALFDHPADFEHAAELAIIRAKKRI